LYPGNKTAAAVFRLQKVTECIENTKIYDIIFSKRTPLIVLL